MATVLLSKRSVDAAEPRANRYELFDTKLKGFGLRVEPSGSKSWFISYRSGEGGRKALKRRYVIGKVGTLTPEQAREAAQRLLASIKLGADPATAKAVRRAVCTVQELVTTFLTQHVEPKRKSTTAANYADMFERLVIPDLGSKKVDAVTRADLARVHLKWAHRPYQANRMLAAVSSMYSVGARMGLCPEGFNPAKGVERYPERGRERYLTTEELERIGVAIREAETVGIPWEVDLTKPTSKHLPKKAEDRRTVIGAEAAAALRLLIFTGARLREILHLRWSEVDVERGLLLLSESKTGKKVIVLNAPALAVLEGLPRSGEYVIPGEPVVLPDGQIEDRPRADLNRPWTVVSRRAGLGGVRLHDLRHTFASYGATGGLGLPIIGKLMGHLNTSTTQRYAHIGSDPLRKASDAIAGTIAAAMGEPVKEGPDADVIPMAGLLRRRSA